jgi:hypothetical protein
MHPTHAHAHCTSHRTHTNVITILTQTHTHTFVAGAVNACRIDTPPGRFRGYAGGMSAGSVRRACATAVATNGRASARWATTGLHPSWAARSRHPVRVAVARASSQAPALSGAVNAPDGVSMRPMQDEETCKRISIAKRCGLATIKANRFAAQKKRASSATAIEGEQWVRLEGQGWRQCHRPCEKYAKRQ